MGKFNSMSPMLLYKLKLIEFQIFISVNYINVSSISSGLAN